MTKKSCSLFHPVSVCFGISLCPFLFFFFFFRSSAFGKKKKNLTSSPILSCYTWTIAVKVYLLKNQNTCELNAYSEDSVLNYKIPAPYFKNISHAFMDFMVFFIKDIFLPINFTNESNFYCASFFFLPIYCPFIPLL